MMREYLRAKIHNATVTEADIEYVGSLTLDRDLMDAAGMVPGRAGSAGGVTSTVSVSVRVEPPPAIPEMPV